MRVPYRSTTAYAIAKLIHQRGPMTEQACIDALPYLSRQTCVRALQRMCENNHLFRREECYCLTPSLQSYYDMERADCSGKVAAAPAPYRPEYKTWSGKYCITAAAQRPDAPAPREIHFYNGGTVPEPTIRSAP